MTEQDVTPESVDQNIARMTDVAEKTRLDYLQLTEQAGAKEAETLQLEKDALAKTLGADHPRVLALERARRSVEAISEFAATTRGYAQFGSKEPAVPFTAIPKTVSEDNSGCLNIFKRSRK